jgi:hypothetical protein
LTQQFITTGRSEMIRQRGLICSGSYPSSLISGELVQRESENGNITLLSIYGMD